MKIKFTLLITFLLLSTTFNILAESIEVNNITWEEIKYQGKEGLKFHIKDLYIYGAKDRNVYFAFALHQKDWLPGSWTQQQPLTVPYAECYWEDAGWFFYPFDYLEEQGGENKDFTGYFFVMNTNDDSELGYQTVEFTTKTVFDFFLENYNRLETHPQSNDYYIDYPLVGDWVYLELGPEQTYSLIVRDMGFNSDGSGQMKIAEWSLMKDGTLQITATEAYDYVWAIVVDYTDEGEPVTLIKMVFLQDSSYIYFYYAYHKESLVCIQHDFATQSASERALNFITKANWEKQWTDEGRQLIADSLLELYKADQYAANVELQNFMMGSMVNNYMFNSFSNTLAGLSPCGIAYY